MVRDAMMPLVTNLASARANQLRTLDCQSSGSLTAMALMLLISLATGPWLATAAEGPGAAALFPRILGKEVTSAAAWCMHANTWLNVKTVAGHHCKRLKLSSLLEYTC